MEFKQKKQPIPNNNIHVHDVVTADLVRKCKYHVASDIQGRKDLGIQRYGTPLQPHNGLDMSQDAYEEILDFLVYSKGCVLEGKQEWEEVYQGALELTIKISKLMLRQ